MCEGRKEEGGRMIEDGGWRMEDGGWRMEGVVDSLDGGLVVCVCYPVFVKLIFIDFSMDSERCDRGQCE